MVRRFDYLPALAVLIAAALAGFLVRWIGQTEGLLPTGGVAPVVVSSLLCLGLWVALWRASRSAYPPLRLALAALVPFLIGATAGVVWATYGVAPGAALAAIAVAFGFAVRF
jgi:hypothetical protein